MSGARRRSRPFLLVGPLTVVLGVLPSIAHAAAGDLDITFSSDGIVTTNFGKGSEQGLAVAIQDDGKIVVAGRAGGLKGDFAIARYEPDGALDTTFSGDGKLKTSFTTNMDTAYDVAIQSDDKIVAAGVAGLKFAVARYKPGGGLDKTFSGDGKVRTNILANIDVGRALALQGDGKIVLAGTAYQSPPDERMGVVRYLTNGALDTTFDGDGKANVDISGSEWAADVAIDGSGNIVLGGGSGDDKIAATRLEPDGDPDMTFGTNGWTTATVGTYGWGTALALGSGPSIVLSGWGDGKMAVLRLDGNGDPDTGFGTQGLKLLDPTTDSDSADDLVLDGPGFVLVGRSGERTLVARLESDGDLDPTFSADGWDTQDLTGGYDNAWGVALDADGKIVFGGNAGSGKFAAARYLSA